MDYRCRCYDGLGGLCGRRDRTSRNARMARFFFLHLLFGQNGFHHIAGLGDV
jgi:hypothetical protein